MPVPIALDAGDRFALSVRGFRHVGCGNAHWCPAIFLNSLSVAYNVTVLVAERVGRMFYLVEPSSTYFTDIAQVPDYITEAIPFFILSVILESILMAFDDDLRPARVNDGIGSMAAGLFQQMFNKILLKGLEIKSFIWCYERFRLWDLSTDSLWTFVAAFIFIDLGYYWFHRMAHEINIFWAGHVVRSRLSPGKKYIEAHGPGSPGSP